MIVILCVLYWFSAQNGILSTNQSNEVLSQLNLDSKNPMYTLVIRKSAHFLIYFVIGVLVYLITESPCKTILAILLIACGDELHQMFVPGRAGRLSDVGIDLLGGICGLMIVRLFKGIFPFK